MDDIGGLLGSVAHGVLQGFGGPLGGISQGIQAHDMRGLMADGMGAGQLGMHMQGMPGQQAPGIDLIRASISQQNAHTARRAQTAAGQPGPMKMTTQIAHLKAVQAEARPVSMMIQGLNDTTELLSQVEQHGAAGPMSKQLAGQYKSMIQNIANARAWAENPMDTEKAAAASKEMFASMGGDEALEGWNFGYMKTKEMLGFLRQTRAKLAVGAAEGVQRMGAIAGSAPTQEEAWGEYTRAADRFNKADIRQRQQAEKERLSNGG